MIAPKIAPRLHALIGDPEDWSERSDHAAVLHELRALLRVAREARREHDPATREIANEDHSSCLVCRALAHLEKLSSRKRRTR